MLEMLPEEMPMHKGQQCTVCHWEKRQCKKNDSFDSRCDTCSANVYSITPLHFHELLTTHYHFAYISLYKSMFFYSMHRQTLKLLG